ncbi:MAG: hypothetical protein M8357_15585 [Desulfobulbaceae bacterium]|nr:hypothetical protein [Desulfobulbaceae bacterium]
MKKNFFLIILLHFVVSCAPLAQIQDKNEQLAYLPQVEDQILLYKHFPVFIIENKSTSYNRIDTAKAELTDDGGEKVYMDPREATVYTEERNFKTANDTYTNLLYRIHFSETSSGLFPFQIAAGKNVGLLRERLLISWWAFDWNIGEGKKLSADKKEPPVFFTSLKPWARQRGIRHAEFPYLSFILGPAPVTGCGWKITQGRQNNRRQIGKQSYFNFGEQYHET